MTEAVRSASVTDIGRWSAERGSNQRSAETDRALRYLHSRSEGTPDDTLVLHGRAELERMLNEVAFERSAGVVRLTEFSAIQAELEQVATKTRREFMSIHSGEAPTEAMLEASTPADEALLARGVRLRIAYPTEFSVLPHMRTYIQHLSSLGGQFSFVDAVPYRILIADRARAIVPIVAQSQLHGALLVTEPIIVHCLHHFARTMLRRGLPVDKIDPKNPTTAPTELERDVIRVMSLGVTDDVAAKQLSVSERTFRRYVANVMTRLGAESRFQAGVRAVERGWL